MKQPRGPKTPKHAPSHMASGSGTLSPGGQKSASGSGALHPKRQQHSASGSGMLHSKQKKPKPAKKPKRGRATGSGTLRGWSPGSDVACCAAEAFGALVIASGRPWSAEQTLALYQRTAQDPQTGASITATLEACESAGRDLNPQTPIAGRSACARLIVHTAPDSDTAPGALGLILGVTLPEPHAIAVTPDGRWWSWGEPFDPGDWPELEIDEAWAVMLWPR